MKLNRYLYLVTFVLAVLTILTAPLALTQARHAANGTVTAEARVPKWDIKFVYPPNPTGEGTDNANRMWDHGLALYQTVNGSDNAGYQCFVLSNESEVCADITLWVGYLAPVKENANGFYTTEGSGWGGILGIDGNTYYQNNHYIDVDPKSIPKEPYIRFLIPTGAYDPLAGNYTWLFGDERTAYGADSKPKMVPLVRGATIGNGVNMTEDLSNEHLHNPSVS